MIQEKEVVNRQRARKYKKTAHILANTEGRDKSVTENRKAL